MCAELSFIFYFSSFSKGQIVTHRCSHSTSQQQSTERQTRIWIISEMRRELSSYLDVVVIFHLHYNNSFMMWHSTLSCHTAHTADAHTIPTIRQSSSSLRCVLFFKNKFSGSFNWNSQLDSEIMMRTLRPADETTLFFLPRLKNWARIFVISGLFFRPLLFIIITITIMNNFLNSFHLLTRRSYLMWLLPSYAACAPTISVRYQTTFFMKEKRDENIPQEWDFFSLQQSESSCSAQITRP